jgi:DNA polymerase-4
MPTILHADLDAFYASVEQRDNPELRGLPVAVANGSARGVVASASYEARRFGVRSAMPVTRARALCPPLVVVLANHPLYHDVSRQIHAVFRRVTPLIEPIALDEAFLDVTAVAPTVEAGLELARGIKAAVREATGLTISVGVATGKMVAKIASGHSKPDGLLGVGAGQEARFLQDLPVSVLWGIGPKREAALAARNITTMGGLVTLDEDTLLELFGRTGPEIRDLAQGIDPRPVVPNRESKSISSETTFEEAVLSTDWGAVASILSGLAAEVAASVAGENLVTRCVAVKIRTADWRIHSRQRTLLSATLAPALIERAAWAEFRRWERERQAAGGRGPARLVLLGVRASDLLHADAPRQLGLFDRLYR